MLKKKSIRKKVVKKKGCILNDRVKNLGICDIGHIKLSVIAFTFFVLSIWSSLYVWVGKIYWAWFLGAMILFSIKPFLNFWNK